MPAAEPTTLSGVVSAYARENRRDAEREIRYFAERPSLTHAVDRAARAIGPNGRRFHHQRRIPRKVLRASAKALLERADDLRAATSFEQLHDLVRSTIDPIPGIGELTVYDTALRIGAYLGLEPEVVFLHAGTREGATALGIPRRTAAVRLADLPPPFRRLRPREVEDCLCIYKRAIRLIQVRPLQQEKSR
jgi:predicted nucleic acid-binding protein